MKKYLYIFSAALVALASCHKPEYVEPTAERQGLTSLTAILVEGPYAGQELAKLTVTDPDASYLEIPIPYYYPEISNEETLIYMMKLRVQAELQPNYKISPKLGVLDLTEENKFTLTDPKGNSREITITGKRAKSSNCALVALMVEDVKTSGIIYEESSKILIPYLEDLSAVQVSGQVTPHAKLLKVNGKVYNEKTKYNLNTGATVTVQAHDGVTERTYTVEQGIPSLLGSGMREASVARLFNVDPETMAGLPPYTDDSFVSLAGLGTYVIVGLGNGRTPVYLDTFTGAKKGQINLGSAVADCLTSDDAGNLVIANFAAGGVEAQDVNIYVTSSVTDAPVLLHTFMNPAMTPVGHRIKVSGNVKKDACIVLTAEGIAGVTTSSEVVYLLVRDGQVSEVKTRNFATLGMGWGAAPVNIATVCPASENPDKDGWFIDYYEGNVDPSVTSESADCYLLHYIDAKDRDHWLDRVGNWGVNPNCLDHKVFNGTPYLTLFAVSHFPQWDIRPKLRLYDATDPSAARLLMGNDNLAIYQKGARNEPTGASGDVVLVPSVDGYRMYLYYYDHHTQVIGAYVADCFEI
ncbi:MAG: DUF5018 domain-containing protein [Bacteroidales bacterium]|nr:DUF5018 domain-containing protein [Bacteroidales bacterium]